MFMRAGGFLVDVIEKRTEFFRPLAVGIHLLDSTRHRDRVDALVERLFHRLEERPQGVEDWVASRSLTKNVQEVFRGLRKRSRDEPCGRRGSRRDLAVN